MDSQRIRKAANDGGWIPNDLDNSSIEGGPLGSVLIGGEITEDDSDGDRDFLSSTEAFTLRRPGTRERIDAERDGDEINGVQLRVGD